MYISRIKLQNWKNFRQVEADLGLRVFLIGPNASGKSNLLDAFRLLRDIADTGLRRAIDDQRGGVSSVRCLAARNVSDIVIEVEVVEDDMEQWRYRLVFKQDNLRRAEVREEKAWHNGDLVLERPNEQDREDPLRLTQTHLEQIAANQEFRGLANFFKSITYQNLLPQVVRDPRGFSPIAVQEDPYGRDFLLRVWKTNARTRDSRLDKIVEVLRAAVPQLSKLRMELDDSGTPHLIGGYSHWRPHAAKQDEGQFSDGTLRLFGLLWTVLEGSGPLLLEEPEISLHPEVVRQLPAIFHRIARSRKQARQIIISTHSREMLSDQGIAPEEVLILEPTADGTVFRPLEEADRQAMRHGLTAADLLIPKTTPKNIQQLAINFPA